jgi:hypothetical protein
MQTGSIQRNNGAFADALAGISTVQFNSQRTVKNGPFDSGVNTLEGITVTREYPTEEDANVVLEALKAVDPDAYVRICDRLVDEIYCGSDELTRMINVEREFRQQIYYAYNEPWPGEDDGRLPMPDVDASRPAAMLRDNG